MKIIIKDTNRERINAAIAQVEGRARARTVAYSDLLDAIKRLEWKLDIPKSCMVGVEAEVDWRAQTFPNAYRFIPESTHVTIIRTSSGWALTSIRREPCGTKEFVVRLTEKAKQAIIEAHQRF